MIIILDQMAVTKELKDKVLTYLNKPRKEMVAHSPGTFEKYDSNAGHEFTSDLFHTRVLEAMDEWNGRLCVSEESMVVTQGVLPQASMALYFIVTEDNQVIIISVDDKCDDIDDTYWMGLAYFGEESIFGNLLGELGIDINKALNNETL